jgi:ABC-type transporter Mla maintaining outer membrane lipid asymmetry ATPase subunit MlaF
MHSAYRISDRIAMLYEGKVLQEGTPDEIRNSENPIVRGFVEGRPELVESGEVEGARPPMIYERRRGSRERRAT